MPLELGPNGLMLQGDCLVRLRELPDASVHSVVTDPPYGLSDHKPEEVIACLMAWLAGEPYVPKGKGFMGKTWDAWVPGPEVWRECLRVLKPGGHLVAFAGTRSMDLMCMAVRLAGFELRDSIGFAHDDELDHDTGGAPLIAWTHGQGFPKSMDVSKALDKAAGAEREVIGEIVRGDVQKAKSAGVTMAAANANRNNKAIFGYGVEKVTRPATDAAKQWEGWGTALKPAFEPIILARKSLTGTVAANVLEHGTGALNIDGCRVAGTVTSNPLVRNAKGFSSTGLVQGETGRGTNSDGRFPANLVHDGSEAVLAAFPAAPGQQGALTGAEPSAKTANTYGDYAGRAPSTPREDGTTSAARFFYCAKATKKDRDEGLADFPLQTADPYAEHRGRRMPEGSDRFDGKPAAQGRNTHPTVKPTNLMRWLVRLVTPPDGVVLDPFMGSGSTGKAAVLEGFRFVGIEQDAESFRISQARVKAAVARKTEETLNAERLTFNAQVEQAA